MRILVVSPGIPSRHAKGFQVMAYSRVVHLARSHQVTVLCFEPRTPAEHRAADDLEAIGVRLLAVPLQRINAAVGVVRMLLHGLPLQCGIYWSHALRSEIDRLQREEPVDIVYAVTIRVFPNLRDCAGPIVIDFVDSMALNFQRKADKASWPLRVVWKLEANRALRYERQIAESSRAAFVVSAIDQGVIGHPNVQVLPLGVDDVYLQCERAAGPQGDVLLFSGNMAYEPNVAAVEWFVSECWSALKARFPNLKLVVAGANPVPAIVALAQDPAIEVTGWVESMASVMQRASLAIAPMRSGSGMQFKILEAMASGLPVVATTLGKGDIRATSRDGLLAADTAREFVDAISDMISDPAARASSGRAARAYVRRVHDWARINQAFEVAALQS